jgi:hypothetical protein
MRHIADQAPARPELTRAMAGLVASRGRPMPPAPSHEQKRRKAREHAASHVCLSCSLHCARFRASLFEIEGVRVRACWDCRVAPRKQGVTAPEPPESGGSFPGGRRGIEGANSRMRALGGWVGFSGGRAAAAGGGARLVGSGGGGCDATNGHACGVLREATGCGGSLAIFDTGAGKVVETGRVGR